MITTHAPKRKKKASLFELRSAMTIVAFCITLPSWPKLSAWNLATFQAMCCTPELGSER
jgi:hypothetical protein